MISYRVDGPILILTIGASTYAERTAVEQSGVDGRLFQIVAAEHELRVRLFRDEAEARQ